MNRTIDVVLRVTGDDGATIFLSKATYLSESLADDTQHVASELLHALHDEYLQVERKNPEYIREVIAILNERAKASSSPVRVQSIFAAIANLKGQIKEQPEEKDESWKLRVTKKSGA